MTGVALAAVLSTDALIRFAISAWFSITSVVGLTLDVVERCTEEISLLG